MTNVVSLFFKKKGLAQLLVNAKEKDGFTPVHFAALRGLYEVSRATLVMYTSLDCILIILLLCESKITSCK